MDCPGAKNWRVAPLGGQPHENEIILLGPAEAPIAVLRKRHRFRLAAKAPRSADLQGFLRAMLAAAPEPRGGVGLRSTSIRRAFFRAKPPRTSVVPGGPTNGEGSRIPDRPLAASGTTTYVAIRSNQRGRLRRRGASRLLLVRSEPCAFGLGEAFCSLFGLEADDSLVVIDGHDDCVSSRA